MKRILCVAVLLGLTTALHAGRYDWKRDTGSFQNAEGETLGAYTDITGLTISVIFHPGTESSQAHSILAFRQKNANGSTTDIITVRVEKDDSGKFRSGYTVNGKSYTSQYDSFWGNTATKDGNITMYFLFEDFDDGVFTTMRPQMVIGGLIGIDAINNETFDLNGKSFDLLVGLDGATINSASIIIDGTPAPEPGVLALLALGVAGLALRRKVA